MFLKLLFQVTEITLLNLRKNFCCDIYCLQSCLPQVYTSLNFEEEISDIYFGYIFIMASRDIFFSAFQSTQAVSFRIALLAQFEDASKQQL